MKKIFVRNVGFGDCLWTEPIVRHFLSEGEEVLIQMEHPCIFDHYPNKGLVVNQPEKIFPLTSLPISLKFQEEPKMHYLEAFRKSAGIPEMKLTYPEIHLSQEEKKRNIPNRYAILHLDKYENKSNFRNVYGVDWEKVIDYLQSQGVEPIQISRDGSNLVTNWIPTRNFREIMSLIYHADLFIGLDSGPSHIAASMRIPAVIFFGSVNPKYRHLDLDKKIFLQRPCQFAHCYHEIPNTFGQPCRLVKQNGHPPCCEQTSEKVIEAIASLGSKTLKLE